MDEQKSGARHSASDQQRIQDIHDHAIALGAMPMQQKDWEEMKNAPQAESETLVASGGTLKAVGDKFEGLLVKFTTPDDPDLTGDYFDAATDFGIEDGSKTPIYFNHRLPIRTRDGQEIRVKSKIGEGRLRIVEDGVMLEDAILYNRTEYEKAIRKTAMAGQMGLSSGTAAHLVDREEKGAAFHITTWQLGLDASTTPTPAEPRTWIRAAKSLDVLEFDFDVDGFVPESNAPEAEPQADAKTDAAQAASVAVKQIEEAVQTATEENEMDEKTLAELKAQMDAQAAKMAEMEAKLNAPPINGAPGVLSGKMEMAAHIKSGRGDSAQKSLMWYLKTGDPSGIRTGEAYEEARNNGDLEAKTNYILVEGTQYQGQEAVPTEVYNGIIRKRNAVAWARAGGAQIIPANSNAMVVPIEKAGPQVFGITAADGATAMTTLTQQPIDKLAATIYQFTYNIPMHITLLDDSVFNVEGWATDYVARGLVTTENTYTTMGTGSSQPQGAIYGSTLGKTAASGTAVTSAEVAALYYAIPAEYQDNVSWAMLTATHGTVRGLGGPTGGFAFVGNGGYAGGVGDGGAAPNAGWLVDVRSKVYTPVGVDALTTSKKPIFAGNLNAGYAIVERKGLTVLRDPYSGANVGNVNLWFYSRWTAGVTNALALYYLATPSA